MTPHDAHRLELKEHAIRFLSYLADRAKRRGMPEREATFQRRINELVLDCNAIRAGRP